MTESFVYRGDNSFLRSIAKQFHKMKRYENEELKKKALAVIPVDDLQFKAICRMRQIQAQIKEKETEEPEMPLEQAVLLELMSWFKKHFFKWMDKPSCKDCHGETKTSKTLKMHISGDNIRVEVYKCSKCQTETEFPRYKNPGTLLTTRIGRCGEWANCFTLMCRALNYDTRFVLDTTDHVWVEIYSHLEKKWIHCDPCENAYDTPLMYEVGWGKKLEYVIAYSIDDVQDVTWRYTTNHKEVLQRRTKCSEAELVNLIVDLNNSRLQKLTPARAKFCQSRTLAELVSLMIEGKPKDQEKIGRTSGSLTWRLQRKELKPWKPYTWRNSKHREMCIRYSPTKDRYETLLPDNKKVVHRKVYGWMEGAYEIKNIFRKEEEDWKMVYLAREEKKDTGKISWRFSTDSKSMCIKSISLKLHSACYENGSVNWVLCFEDRCMKIPKEEETSFKISGLKNVSEVTLTAQLSGGKGDMAWQHAQLFRQSFDSKSYPLHIVIKYKPREA